MKKIIIISIVYLSGCFFGYKYTKHNIQSQSETTWTVRDRKFSIGLSIGSWLTVVAMGFVDFYHSPDNNTPANW